MLSELDIYIKEVKNKPFKWGEHDCLIFSNTAWRKMYGFGWADDWLDRYYKETEYGIRTLRQDELKKEFGYFDFNKAVDDKLQRISYVPPKGSLVTTTKTERWAVGKALGISLGLKAVFVGKNGLTTFPIDEIENAWVNR